MSIEIREINNGRVNVLATRETFEDAKAFVRSINVGVCHMEDDGDYPNCADAFLNDGRVIAIQPVGFKL